MAKKKKYIIGVDLGGTKMLAGILDRDYRLKATEKSRVQAAEGEKVFFKTLVDNIGKLLKEYKVNRKELLGIGIGCPGIIDPVKGTVITSPNIPFLKNKPLAKKLKKIFGVPVVVGNDVNVGLLGEQRLGAARKYRDVIGVFIGTGVGGALILNNEIYAGATGGAGEIGHMLAASSGTGPLCGCGKRGCLEMFCGRVSIAAEAAMLATRQQAPKLFQAIQGDVSKIKSGVLAKSIKAGDKAIRDLIVYRAKKLGTALGSLVNILNPEAIVLGGGVMEALGSIILPVAEEAMREAAMGPLVKRVKVVAAKLGDDAIVKGAAVMLQESERGR